MLKLTAVVSLMLIGTSIWAAGLSCDSCGSECASACGTKHFRSCCFNYLRRKRGPEFGIKFWPQSRQTQEPRTPPNPSVSAVPVFLMENGPSFPELWLNHLPSDYKVNLPRYDEDIENRAQILYD